MLCLFLSKNAHTLAILLWFSSEFDLESDYYVAKIDLNIVYLCKIDLFCDCNRKIIKEYIRFRNKRKCIWLILMICWYTTNFNKEILAPGPFFNNSILSHIFQVLSQSPWNVMQN